ncbi:MAG: acyltransferase [Acidimicrobiia bacterium]
MIVTSDHQLGDSYRRAGPLAAEEVTIEDGCWIGARVTVLPGSSIGAGSVVAAGAVVRGALAPNGLYAGVPARLVRPLS